MSSSLYTYVPAAFFGGMSLLALLRPAEILRPFGGLAPTPDSRTEVRAVYGGFGAAVGWLLLRAAASKDTAPGESKWVLLTVAGSLAGMAAGRVAGVAVEPGQRFYPTWFYVLAELGMAASLAKAAGW
ncbi:hypothetical protein DFJ74DRAFT_706370 [Hyaloraphidium curvatum]|nr:hypothetical protein DFJ74DRAFT_706370 [Hyaloraphidium curvatum]